MLSFRQRVACALAPLAFATALAAPAQATTINFVDEATEWSAARTGPNNSQATRTIGGVEVSLTATRVMGDGSNTARRLNFFEGGTADGVGIGDDEITRAPDGSAFSHEILTLTFSESVVVTGFDFLDLFVDAWNTAKRDTPMDQRERETAQVDFNNGQAVRLFEAEQLRGTGLGLLVANFEGVETSKLSFSVWSPDNGLLGPTDDRQPDYALGAVRFETAVAPVPLPAAAWMLIAGLAALVGLGRRANRA